MRIRRLVVLHTFAALFSAFAVLASNNPVPFIDQPLVPSAAAPGGSAFTLTVNGAGFVAGSTVLWNGSARTTTFVSGTRLTAAIPATDIATATTASVTVSSPGPGGGTSNIVFFQVSSQTTSVAYSIFNGYGSGGASNSQRKFAIADFNGDGKMDVATLNGDGSVSVLLGNGNGTFGLPTVLQPDLATAEADMFFTGTPSASPVGIVVGDFNGDGKLDIAIEDALTAPGTGTFINVFLGNGTGTFGSPITSVAVVGAGSNGQFLLAGDFNADGILDLLAPPSAMGGSLRVLTGNGDGTFTLSGSIASPSGLALLSSPALGDFNGDGKLDVVLPYTDLSNNMTVAIALGNGDGTFGALTTIESIPGSNGASLAVAASDFDENGILDVAFYYPNCSPTCTGTASLDMLSGVGDGTFLSPLTVTNLPMGSPTLVVADLNEDNHSDLLVLNTPLLGRGDGTFIVNPVTLPNSGAAVGDFNGDGMLDVISPDPLGFFLDLRTTPDFSGFSSPTSQTVIAGGNTVYNIFLTPLYGSENDVTLTLSGVPAGVTASFQPQTVPGANGSSLLSINTSASTVPATYTLTLTGTASNGVTRSTALTLSVNPPTADFGGDITPTMQLIAAGQTAGYMVTVVPINGFTGDVTLSASGYPAGSVVTFNPAVVTGGSGTSLVSVTPPSGTQSGVYILTISGTSGSLVHSGKRELDVNNNADFSGFVNPPTNSVVPGQRAAYTINVTSMNGYTGSTSLSVSGLPPGATYRLTPSMVMGGAGSSSLLITTSSTLTPLGTYTITITGQSGSDSKSTTIQLEVDPSQGDFSGSINPTSQSVTAGTSASYAVTIFPVSGFTGNVTISVTGLPTGATLSFAPSNVVTGGSGTVNFTITTTDVATGTYTMLVTGTSGGLSHSGSITLTVN
jgi:hypothetical protein